MSAPEERRSHGDRPSREYTDALRWYQCPDTGNLVRREIAHDGRNGADSLLVVHVVDLQPPLRRWIAKIDSVLVPSHNFRKASDGSPLPTPLSGMQRLVSATGYDPRQLRILIYGDAYDPKGKPRWCGIEKAEAILQVADLEYMLAAGEIKIRRNPIMRVETWESRMRARGVDDPYETLT